MSILVAYASKYGATEGIAERIADQLQASGLQAELRPVSAVGDVGGYEAFVIGGAAYIGHWLKEATEFVRRNRAVLAERPVWLFSDGPLGSETTDAQGRDVRGSAEPEEFGELREAISPRDTRVFFGALDPDKLRLRDRVIRTLPAGRALLPEGDFRDWQDIEAWAGQIADELAPAPGGD